MATVETLQLQIVTPEGPVFQGPAKMVELPTKEGELGIFPGHVPLFAELATGEITAYHEEKTTSFVVSGGYVEIRPYSIRVLALFATEDEEEFQIEEACRRARTAMETAVQLTPEQVDAELGMLRVELKRGRQKQGGKMAG
jgi:F-type H+-transporting ATPase subunit epsilon